MTESLSERLRDRVSRAEDPSQRDALILDLVFALCQEGELSEASELLQQLKSPVRSRRPEVLIRALIAEGVNQYYSGAIEVGFDRASRAKALASAAQHFGLVFEASVWMGQIGFNSGRYGELPRLMKIARDNVEYCESASLARLLLLIADLMQYVCGFSEARRWYELARKLAQHRHDWGLLAAIEYNRFAIGVSRLRFRKFCLLAPEDNEFREWLSELRSISRLHDALSVSLRTEFLEYCWLLADELVGEFGDAVKRIEALRASGALSKCGVSEAVAELEEQWCRMKLGGINERCGQLDTLAAEQSLNALVELDSGQSVMGYFFLSELNEALDWKIDKTKIAHLRARAVEQFQGELNCMKSAVEIVRGDFEVFYEQVNTKSAGEKSL